MAQAHAMTPICLQCLTLPDSLKKIIKKQNPIKSAARTQALIEAAATDQPDSRGKDFDYVSFFAENRNGDQGEVCVGLFAQ